MSQILNQVSDKEIAKEYKKRFFLKSGDKLSGSQDAQRYYYQMTQAENSSQ